MDLFDKLFDKLFKNPNTIRTIAVKSKNTDKYDNPIGVDSINIQLNNTNKSKIDKLELFSGETKTQKFAFLISILLILFSILDLIIMLAPLDVPNWDPAASIVALVTPMFISYLLYKIAYRKKQGTVDIAPTVTVPK